MLHMADLQSWACTKAAPNRKQVSRTAFFGSLASLWPVWSALHHHTHSHQHPVTSAHTPCQKTRLSFKFRLQRERKGLKIPDLLCFTSSSPSPPWAKVEYWWNFSGVLQSWGQVSEGLLNIELEFNKTMTHTHKHPKYHFEGFSFKRSSFLALQFERNILLPAVKAPKPSSWCRNSQGFKSHWCLETYAWYSTLPAAVKMPRVWYLWITKANCL